MSPRRAAMTAAPGTAAACTWKGLVKFPASKEAAMSRMCRRMRDIAASFEAGNFTKPFQVHAAAVPGAAVMAARRGDITYQEIDRPRGAEVRIHSSDAAAVAAVHEFLTFQRRAHHASGHEGEVHHGRP